MRKKIVIPGWQSWSPINHGGFLLRRQCDYSPHGINKWSLPISKKLKKPIAGWCSWYAYGSKISEGKILENAKVFAKYKTGNLPKYVIIDDGWAKWGDWMRPSKKVFPRGVSNLTSHIKSLGLKIGLWFAPFLVDKNSDLSIHFSKYLVKNSYGFVDGLRMLPFNPSFYSSKAILDIEKPHALNYVKRCIKIFMEKWGIDLLKLDFLYAVYFNPRYKTPDIPDQLIRELLRFIKSSYPQVYTIGCGVPLGPAAGLVDSVRISADIIVPQVDNIWPTNMLINGSRLSQLTKNIKGRKEAGKIWNLDPDIYVCRKETGFTHFQVSELKEMIKSLGGNMILGDDLSKVNAQNLFD